MPEDEAKIRFILEDQGEQPRQPGHAGPQPSIPPPAPPPQIPREEGPGPSLLPVAPAPALEETVLEKFLRELKSGEHRYPPPEPATPGVVQPDTPVETEIIQPDPVETEVVQPEPVEVEVIQPEPIEIPQPEPTSVEIVQPEPLETKVDQPEPVEVEVKQPGPFEAEIEQPEPVTPEILQPEPVTPEVLQPGPVTPEVLQPEPVDIDVIHPEPVAATGFIDAQPEREEEREGGAPATPIKIPQPGAGPTVKPPAPVAAGIGAGQVVKPPTPITTGAGAGVGALAAGGGAAGVGAGVGVPPIPVAPGAAVPVPVAPGVGAPPVPVATGVGTGAAAPSVGGAAGAAGAAGGAGGGAAAGALAAIAAPAIIAAGAVAAVAGAAYGLKKGFDVLSDATDDVADELEEFAAPIIAEEAMAGVRELIQQMEWAQELGPMLGAYTKAQAEVSEEWRDLKMAVMKKIIPPLVIIMKVLTKVLDWIEKGYKVLELLLSTILDIMQLIPLVGPLVRRIRDSLDRIARNTEPGGGMAGPLNISDLLQGGSAPEYRYRGRGLPPGDF